jgi:hypothetical protein
MQQTFEYYIVNPNTWKDSEQIKNITSSTINRDADAETLGSASFDITESVGECYIRVYLIAIQNGIREKIALGTFLVQTPSSTFDGKIRKVSMDAYTPLLELKEGLPPIGFYTPKGDNILLTSVKLINEHSRAPVVITEDDATIPYDFVSNTEDTWLSYVTDLIGNAKYALDLDENGRILLSKKQDIASLQPVWTYEDGKDSILYPNQDMNHDLYGIPNVVEVIYSQYSENFYIRVVNDDPNSPTSTVSRGREIVHRVTSPEVIGIPTEAQLKEYAEQLLRDLSTVEYMISYTHGYCPVRVGDCVRINSIRAGLTNIKAKVISQSIRCEPGCPVTEKAVFTMKLWR